MGKPRSTRIRRPAGTKLPARGEAQGTKSTETGETKPAARTMASPVTTPRAVAAERPAVDPDPLVVDTRPEDPAVDAFQLEEAADAAAPAPLLPQFDPEEDLDEDLADDDVPLPRVKGKVLTAEEQAALENAAPVAFKKIEASDLVIKTAEDADRQQAASDENLNDMLEARYPTQADGTVKDRDAEQGADEFQRWLQRSGMDKTAGPAPDPTPAAAPVVQPPFQAAAQAGRLSVGSQVESARPIDTGLQGEQPADDYARKRARVDAWKAGARKVGQITPVARQASEKGHPVIFAWKGDTCYGFITPDELNGMRQFHVGIEFEQTFF